MLKSLSLAAALAWALLIDAPAHAAKWTVTALADACGSAEAIAQVACGQYMLGLWDDKMSDQQAYGDQPYHGKLCAPRGPTGEELRRVYLSWINSHRIGDPNAPAISGAYLALT